jgi:hypothetical protein
MHAYGDDILFVNNVSTARNKKLFYALHRYRRRK